MKIPTDEEKTVPWGFSHELEPHFVRENKLSTLCCLIDDITFLISAFVFSIYDPKCREILGLKTAFSEIMQFLGNISNGEAVQCNPHLVE